MSVETTSGRVFWPRWYHDVISHCVGSAKVVKRPLMEMANEKLLVTGDDLTEERQVSPAPRLSPRPRTSSRHGEACVAHFPEGVPCVVYSVHQKLRLQEGPKVPATCHRWRLRGFSPLGPTPLPPLLRAPLGKPRNLKEK